jgi:creatinine amidohydrolase/Fe(II)-dependent formamide hydrolase-like protein
MPRSFRSLLLLALRSVSRRVALALALLAGTCAWAQAPSVYLEELTSPELRERIAAGATTVLVPIGGTEQNGPHMVLGKHNVRARVLAGLIAQRLGNAIVAPVMAYVPEGAIHPPVAHMRFSGTISLPDAVFEAVLEAAARSFKQHGFKDVVFLGDHGGYQKSDERVAAKLNHEWAADPSCRVLALGEYYRITQTAFVDDLKKKGYTEAEIGTHAGLADTALALAVDKALVRPVLLASSNKPADGVHGDPRRATVEMGQMGVQRIVDTSALAIRAATRSDNRSR